MLQLDRLCELREQWRLSSASGQNGSIWL